MPEDIHLVDTLSNEYNYFGDIRLFQIGEVCCEPGYGSFLHRQWCYEITYIISGNGISTQNGLSCSVQTNDVILNLSTGEHSIMADSNSRLRYICLGFNVPDTEEKDPALARVLRQFDNNGNLCMPDKAGVGMLMRKLMEEYYSKQEGYEEIVATALRLVILLAQRNAGTHMEGRKPLAVSAESGLIFNILHYVEDNIRSLPSVRDIAAAMNYNSDYISHMFRARTGETLQNYIRRKKIEKAAELMDTFGMSASQAAEELGYKSVQAFSKAFHSVFGFGPRQYMESRKTPTAHGKGAETDNGGK